MRFFFPAMLLAVLLITVSCRPEEELLSPDLPPTPVLTSDSLWGVAGRPYQKILSEPRGDAEVNGLLRQGDIVEILSKISADDSRSYWLEVKSSADNTRGWVPDSSLNVYDSPAQARTARSGLEEGN
ncbi:MAG: hypothetical protein DRP49_00535 [Spirochaetes bacterium]|nr:MAG: hypothetical protein DRP49_00535 [Spirochaetota bacterium]